LGTVNKWTTLVVVLLFFLGCAIALAIASGFAKELARPWDAVAALSAATLVAIGLTLLFVRWAHIDLKEIGVVPGRRSTSRIVLGLIVGLVMAGLQPLLLALFTSKIHIVLAPKISAASVARAFLLYGLAGVREEIVFRAYPLHTLDKSFGPWIALFIISVVFSLEHVVGGSTWVQAFMGAGVGSILFGVAALCSKGLALPIGLHVAWNFGQWAVGFKDNTGVWRAVVERGDELNVEHIGFISYLIVMTLGIFAFFICWRDAEKR
jgi:membrane protease YdiL (CAAX protease family)